MHPQLAKFLKSRCRSAHRVLLSTEGPFANVIKVKPPICFSAADVDRMVCALSSALSELSSNPGAKVALVAQSRQEALRMEEEMAARSRL